jgi:hypothetical protein
MGRYDTRLPSGESIMIVQVNDDGSASFRYLDGEKKDETGTCEVRTITMTNRVPFRLALLRSSLEKGCIDPYARIV